MHLPPWYLSNLNDAQEIASRQPFFVLGCQKSGTTWLQHLLDAHSQVACGGEGHFMDVLAPLMQQVVNEFNRVGKTQIELTNEHLMSGLRFTMDRCLMDYVRTAGEPMEIRAVGDKTPESAMSVAQLNLLYPNARFVHLIRDGRDACVSGWAHLKRQNQTGKFADLAAYAEYFAKGHWIGYIQSARQAAAELSGRYIEVRYEDLHAQPESETRRLLEFLQVDADEPSVKQCIEAAAFENLSGGRRPGEAQASSHFRKGVIGDHRESMDPAALERFESIAGALMNELGYEPAAATTA